MANRWGNSGNSDRFCIFVAPKALQMVTAAIKLKKRLLLGRKVMTNLDSLLTFLVVQRVKHLLAMRETRIQSLGWEDPLENKMATHSSTLAWEIPWTEKPIGYSLWGCKESDTTELLHFHFQTAY